MAFPKKKVSSTFLMQSVLLAFEEEMSKLGEKRMYTCICNWVAMLYSRKKNCIGEIRIKKLKKNTLFALKIM